jgi:glycosyltransferase involved in cell wall biosynthesis
MVRGSSFISIENVPYDQVMNAYQSIDILIDQIYAGWYGGLAVEAMALGKPVLFYIREDDLKFIPSEMAENLPIVKTCAATLKRNLISLIEMPYEDLLKLGKKSRQYVEKWHNPQKVVRQLIEDMNLN